MLNEDDDISSLWQRHLLAAVRDNLSTASVQAIPSGAHSLQGDERVPRAGGKEAQVGDGWDEQINSVVDALEELTIQSPTTIQTTEPYSPEMPWFGGADRETYTETALSSPQNSSWSRTVGPPKKMQGKRLPSHEGIPEIRVHDTENSPIRDKKGKGLATQQQQQQQQHPDNNTSSTTTWYTERHLPDFQPTDDWPYENYYRNYNIDARNIPPDPPTATVRYAPNRASQMIETLPEQVHVLILTWAKKDDSSHNKRSGDDGWQQPLLSPTFVDVETDAVRASFKRRGYRVQCRRIPEDYPTAAVETILDKFLDNSVEKKSLLVIYYHGYGNMTPDGRMVFSSDQNATSSFFWDDVRDPIMQAPGDVLLIFDCCPLPLPSPSPLLPAPYQQQQQHQSQTLGEPRETLIIEAGMVSSPSTKQLLGICADRPPPSASGKQPSSGSAGPGIMTQALCGILNGKFGERQVSVQSLCSSIKEDLRSSSTSSTTRGSSGSGNNLASKVFVTQLGGGQLWDICLPWFGD